MENYLDDTYAAAYGTILSYTGSDVALRVPARLADMPIVGIGNKAFAESEKLQQVMLPRGITRIGVAFCNCAALMQVIAPGTVKYAERGMFFGCPRLMNLTLYDLPVSRKCYEELKAGSLRYGGSRYLAMTFPDIRDSGLLKNGTMGAGVYSGPAHSIPQGIIGLFTSQSMEEENGQGTLTRNLEWMDCRGSASHARETDTLPVLMKEEGVFIPDGDCEKKNDRFISTDQYPAVGKTAVFTFDDAKTQEGKEGCLLYANVKFGYHFWQSVSPLSYDGKRYFVYRRNYLNADPGLPYIRRDAAICRDGTLVTDREEAQKVYAKYKLLSIL